WRKWAAERIELERGARDPGRPAPAFRAAGRLPGAREGGPLPVPEGGRGTFLPTPDGTFPSAGTARRYRRRKKCGGGQAAPAPQVHAACFLLLVLLRQGGAGRLGRGRDVGLAVRLGLTAGLLAVLAPLDRRQQQLGHVDHLDRLGSGLLVLPGGEPVGEHHAAERAAGRDLRRRGAERLVDALQVDALADALFHPHPGTTGTAAHRPVGVPRHLPEVGAGSADQLARRRVHLVVPTQVAPAPQHIDSTSCRGTSRRSAPEAPTSSRGGVYTLLCRPR